MGVSYDAQKINATNLSSTDNYLEGAKTTVILSQKEDCKIYTLVDIFFNIATNITAPISQYPALKYKVVKGQQTISEGVITKVGDVRLATVALTTTPTNYLVYIWLDSNISNTSNRAFDNKTISGYIYATSNQTSTIPNNSNDYTIIYNANGGTGSMANQAATFGNEVTFIKNTFTKSGYTFGGWTTNSDGTDDGFNWIDGWSGTWKFVNNQYGIQNGKLTLYAKWIKQT